MSPLLRVWFHFLRFMDDIWPGWSAPREPEDGYLGRDNYLGHESYVYWMTRENRR